MQKIDLQVGDILQLSPDYHEPFSGQFIVVTEPKPWGCQGYVIWDDINRAANATTFKGRAFLRPKFENMEYVGKCIWERKQNTEE